VFDFFFFFFLMSNNLLLKVPMLQLTGAKYKYNLVLTRGADRSC
jgi:hypothetical protein